MVSMISEEGRTKVGIYEYVIDTATELSEVPTDVQVGSIVYCIENSKKYMLDSSGNYVEVNFKKGGSGGEAKLGTKDINENGSYKASDFNLDGWSQVNVNINGVDLLATESIGTVSTSSTSSVSLDKTIEVQYDGYELLIIIASTDSPVNGRHYATVMYWFSSLGATRLYTPTINYTLSGNGTTYINIPSSASASYGVYPSSITSSAVKVNLPMYARYNNDETTTINGDYTVRVYGIKQSELIP